MSPIEIENTLKYFLQKLLPHHPISEVYDYATLPGGKLFRPGLVWSILQDLDLDQFQKSLTDKNSPHARLASAVEFHHSYTLIHDDMPCMDNDDMRRGKPSTHKAYGQWQALLAGDGLINISYQLLTHIKHQRSLELMSFFSWALGPKGLIHGQVLDLSQEMTKSFENTIRTHELKTGRLIQVAIVGSSLLTSTTEQIPFKKLWKFSRLLGINFQLLDDLSELSDEQLNEHELSVNPWLIFPEQTYRETLKNLNTFNQLAKELKLVNTNLTINAYYQKMLENFTQKQNVIENHLNKKFDLEPVILLMKSFSKI